MANNPRGVFEKVNGSGVWWIRYHDATGRLRRERAGTKSVAIKLYIKRKQEALEGNKLPENLRKRQTTFGELMDDAIEYSQRNRPEGGEKRYKCRMDIIRERFGLVPADSITPQALSRWLDDCGEPLQGVLLPRLPAGHGERALQDQPGQAGKAAKGRQRAYAISFRRGRAAYPRGYPTRLPRTHARV